MARGNNAQIRTKEATVVILQKQAETFLTTKREVDEESNSFIVNDVSNYEHAHYDNPSTSYSIQKQDDQIDYISNVLSSAICLPEFPARKHSRKRKASVSTSEYASESGFNSESSDEGEGIDGITDQGMPSIPAAFTNKKVFSSFPKGIIFDNNFRSTPFTMAEYMRRSTFMRFTANERRLLERQFRGYLISQLDQKIDGYEGIALNDEEVQDRLNYYEKLPVVNCFACEKAGKSGPSRPSTPNDKELNENGGSRKRVETRPHMKYSVALSNTSGVQVKFRNPLFKKGVARLPDLRLLGHNASKLAPIVLPKRNKRVAKQPPTIHLCDELYGTFEYANYNTTTDTPSKIIRPLIFCKTLYSPESFKHQSSILQRRIENCEGNFYKSRRKRSASESPPFSKVGSVSPFGAFRIRTSRSLSPNRRRHPEMEKPVAIRSPYQCHGETVNKAKGKRQTIKDQPQKFMLCIQSNGSYGAFFYFEKTEQAVLMPTRPANNGTCRFRQLTFENGTNHFNVFEFTVIEAEMFEYLAKLRFMNADNRCIELRPETKFGAVLPRRMIFNYLRLIRKPPKVITWQKKNSKKVAAMPCASTPSSGYCSGSSSSRSSVINANTSAVTITLVDILKWLGFYCVILDEKKARFVLLGAFGGYEYPPFRMTNLLELSQFILNNGGVFCEDPSSNWIQKCQKIEHLVSFQMHALKKEKSLFNTIAIPVSNKRNPAKAASLTCYKLEKSLKLFELYELNACLEKNYYYILSVRYTLYSDPDSCEYDTEMEEDFEWESNATIYNLGDPQPLYQHQYSLGDFSTTKMKNIRNKDVSNVIPRSRYLLDKLQAGTGKPTPKKKARSKLSTKKRYRNWDSSSNDDEDEDRSNRSEVVTPMSDFGIDFDDVEPMEIVVEKEKEDDTVPSTYIPEGEKEFEDNDIILMLATDAPLPKKYVDGVVPESSRMAEIDTSLINSDSLLNEVAASQETSIKNQLSIEMPSESVNNENRKVRFKLSPVSKSQTLKKITILKSCLKKKRIDADFSAPESNKTDSTFKITLSTPTEETRILYEIQVETEAEKQRRKEKHEALIKEIKIELKKPLIQKLKEAKLEIRRSYGLPDEDYIERNPDSKWRPVAADVDEAEFEALLKHLEYNWFWYWSGWQKLKDTFKADFLGSNYSIFLHYKEIETAKALQESRPENRNRRSRSIDPIQLRFSYHEILNDEYNDNTEKTPFEHYYDREYCVPETSTEEGEEEELVVPKPSTPKFHRRRRSVSLPPKFL